MNYYGTETIEFTRPELYRILFALEVSLEYHKGHPMEIENIESAKLKVNDAIERINAEV
jgi:hypothetical protein